MNDITTDEEALVDNFYNARKRWTEGEDIVHAKKQLDSIATERAAYIETMRKREAEMEAQHNREKESLITEEKQQIKIYDDSEALCREVIDGALADYTSSLEAVKQHLHRNGDPVQETVLSLDFRDDMVTLPFKITDEQKKVISELIAGKGDEEADITSIVNTNGSITTRIIRRKKGEPATIQLHGTMSKEQAEALGKSIGRMESADLYGLPRGGKHAHDGIRPELADELRAVVEENDIEDAPTLDGEAEPEEETEQPGTAQRRATPWD